MLLGEHAVVYGKPCLVTAVDQRIYLTVVLQKGNLIEIHAPDVDIYDWKLDLKQLNTADVPKGARFIVAGIRSFFKKYGVSSGLKIETRSDFSSQFGFGSSSATSVGIIKALADVFGKKISKRGLFNLSYAAVLEVQGVGSGFDLAAAIWGGTIYFAGKSKQVKTINTGKLPLIIGYTGIKADTASLVKHVAEIRAQNPKQVDRVFKQIGNLVIQAKHALLDNDFERVGKLMNTNQLLLNKLDVSSKIIEDLILAAKNKNAYGAKLSGAGGGDCVIAFVNDKDKMSVEKAIQDKGGIVINVSAGAKGVRTETK